VAIDEVKVDDERATVEAAAGRSYFLKVGKRRFARVSFKEDGRVKSEE
jgi:hypothetical protein